MDDGDDPFASGAVDLDMALDLDHSRGIGQRPQRPARFQPRVKGKIKAEPSADPEPPRQPPPAPDPVKKQEAEGDPSTSSVSSAPDVDAVATEAMDVDEEEEDSVVREIGVFFTPAPLDEDTSVSATLSFLIMKCDVRSESIVVLSLGFDVYDVILE